MTGQDSNDDSDSPPATGGDESSSRSDRRRFTGGDRRRFLKTVGAASLSVSLAGCNLFDSDDDSTGGSSDDGNTDDGNTDDGNSTGEPKETVTREAVADSVGLTADGIEDLGYPSTETGTPVATPRVTVTHEGPDKRYEATLEETRFEFDGVDFPVKVLASPSLEIDGQERNPVLTLSLLDHVATSEGRFGLDWLESAGLVSGTSLELKSSIVVAAPSGSAYDPTGNAGSNAPSLLGNTIQYGGFQGGVYGVIEAEIGPANSSNQRDFTTVHVAVGRVTDSGDGVMVGVATAVPAASGSISRERLAYVAETAADEVTRNPPVSFAQPSTSLRDSRLVQVVSDSQVLNRNPVYRVNEPDLVLGEYTAPVFDVGGSTHPERLYCDLQAAGGTSDEFGLERTELSGGTLGDVASAFEQNKETDAPLDPPTPFRLRQNTGAVTVRAEAPCGRELDSATITNYNTSDLDNMRVGFIPVRDPNFLGNTAYGTTSTYQETVEMAVQYLRRVFPGGLYAYRHDTAIRGAAAAGPNDTPVRYLPVLDDTSEAQAELNRISSGVSASPSDGALWAYGGSRSDAATAIQNNGFNAWVLIVPDGYYGYHGFPVTGMTVPIPTSQSTTANLYAASALETRSTSDDRRAAQTVAHELGHFYAGAFPYRFGPGDRPLAQRDDDSSITSVNGEPVDFSHARNPNSDHDEDGDFDQPGIGSLGFDFTGGTYRHVQYMTADSSGGGQVTINGQGGSADPPTNRLESYMSYRDNRTLWADTRMQQILTTNVWRASRLNEVAFMARASPAEQEANGPIRIDSTRVQQNVPVTPDADGAVRLTMRSPTDEEVAVRRVSSTATVSEFGAEVRHLAVRLPFPTQAVEFRADRNGQTTRLNALTRPIRDAIDRVPDRGFRDEPAAARAELGERLELVESLMRDREYAEALEEGFPLVEELLTGTVRESYDALANQPERPALLNLVQRMRERLATVANSR